MVSVSLPEFDLSLYIRQVYNLHYQNSLQFLLLLSLQHVCDRGEVPMGGLHYYKNSGLQNEEQRPRERDVLHQLYNPSSCCAQ